jgi:uncharacterized protein VirK/YbjX
MQTKLGEMVCKQRELLMPKACSRYEKLVTSQTFMLFRQEIYLPNSTGQKFFLRNSQLLT